MHCLKGRGLPNIDDRGPHTHKVDLTYKVKAEATSPAPQKPRKRRTKAEPKLNGRKLEANVRQTKSKKPENPKEPAVRSKRKTGSSKPAATTASEKATPQSVPTSESAQNASNSTKASPFASTEGEQHTGQPLDIVFVSAEVAPWSKTGGLGDVVGSLPIALARRGHRVMVVAPRYQHGNAKLDGLYEPAKEMQAPTTLDLGHSGQQQVNYFHLHKDHVDWVFVDHPSYQRAGNPYADEHGSFGDNQFRYALLSMAACEAPLQLCIGGHRHGTPPGFPYGENVLFIANDWHAGLVPAYLAGKYRRNGVYKDARCILAIHNLSHQGVDPAATYPHLGLPDDWYDALSWEYPSWAAINGAAVNILKGAIATADRILTVSQGYAWEITTKEGGWGLDEVLKSRQHVLNGIANGIDIAEWDPARDNLIPATYSAADLSGKARCKRDLQEELGLPIHTDVPLLGFIGRLDYQKGPDLLLDAVQELVRRDCQIVMLGSGAEEYERRMRESESQYPNHFRGWVGFSIEVAHKVVAGCDIVLMPSRFEPCGLNQLFAMRYGTIPVAHATGGLKDTIEEFNPYAEGGEIGTGWTHFPCETPAMLAAIDFALTTYRSHPKSWQKVMLNGMAKDLSWDRAARQYEQIFEWALLDPPVRTS